MYTIIVIVGVVLLLGIWGVIVHVQHEKLRQRVLQRAKCVLVHYEPFFARVDETIEDMSILQLRELCSMSDARFKEIVGQLASLK